MQHDSCRRLRNLLHAAALQANSVPLLSIPDYSTSTKREPFMSNTDNPEDPDETPDLAAFEDDQALVLNTLPIFKSLHEHLAQSFSDTTNTPSLEEQIKSIFDGAILAHDRARTQDWPNLETQLEKVAADTVMALIRLRNRHANVGRSGASTP